VNPASGNNFAIRAAIKHDHADAVKQLLQDPRVDPTTEDNIVFYIATYYGHPETMSVLLEDTRFNLTADQSRGFIHTAIQNGFVDIAAILFARFPLAHVQTTELIALCADHGRSEILKVFLQHMQQQEDEVQLTSTVRESLQRAFKNDHHQFILELLTQSKDLGIANIVTTLLNENDKALFFKLAFMHANVRRVLLRNCGSSFNVIVSRDMLSSACYNGSADVVRELLDNHQDKFGDCTMNDKEEFFHLARKHVDVVRVLLSKFGSSFNVLVSRNMLSSASYNASADVVRELLDNHRVKFGDWTVDDFNAAALRGNEPVLRLLSLSRYGGFKKLANSPPLNRICTRRALSEMYVKSSVMLMWCIKKKTTSRTMAKLLDVLRDLVSSDLLCYELK
jgi:thymidylate kinase